MKSHVLNIPVEWQGHRWQAFARMKRKKNGKKQAGKGVQEREREKETEQRDIPRPEFED